MSATDPYSARGHLRFAAACILGLILGFGGWAFGAQLAGSVAASGEIELDQYRYRLQHPEGGMVSEILVDDGDIVVPGQILLRLDSEQDFSERKILEMRHFSTTAQRARLETERDEKTDIAFRASLMAAARTQDAIADMIEGQRVLLAARRANRAAAKAQLVQRRAQIAQKIDGFDAQVQALARQRSLVIEERQIQSELQERGLTQAARGMALDREHARLDGEIVALRATQAAARESAREAEAQITLLRTAYREEIERELRDITAAEREFAERLRALDMRISERMIKAPIAGTVHGLQVTRPRSFLRAGEPALYLIPSDSTHMIVARVTPSDIRQVFPDQSTAIYIAGPSDRAIPQLTGRVTRISADRVTDKATQQVYYRVDLKLDPQSLDALAADKLLPGLPVEVFFATRTQRPIHYLTAPLTNFFRHALREG